MLKEGDECEDGEGGEQQEAECSKGMEWAVMRAEYAEAVDKVRRQAEQKRAAPVEVEDAAEEQVQVQPKKKAKATAAKKTAAKQPAVKKAAVKKAKAAKDPKAKAGSKGSKKGRLR